MNIHEKISQVMRDCGAVAKNSFNPQQKYKYRGIDAVMNALNPAMSKNGIFVVPEVQDIQREERETQKGGTLIYSIVTVKYTFYAEDGSSVSCVVKGEGMDSGDKSVNKAMSAAFKYACFQTFCIPTDEMVDSETDSPEPKRKTAAEMPIGDVKARALATMLAEKEIDVQYIIDGYKVKTLNELTEKQHSQIVHNIDEIKRRYMHGRQSEAGGDNQKLQNAEASADV